MLLVHRFISVLFFDRLSAHQQLHILAGDHVNTSKDSGTVVLETSMGRIVLELYWKHAPKTCANFYQLAKQGFYDGIIFHRVISDFMIQGGDPQGQAQAVHLSTAEPSRTSCIQSCDSSVLVSLRWPTRDQTPTGVSSS